MSKQHDKAMELAARLGDKVFGLTVSWKGCTLTVMHFGSEEEKWLAEGYADTPEGGDGGELCQAEGATAEEAMDAVTSKIEALENGGEVKFPDRFDGPDEDPAMY